MQQNAMKTYSAFVYEIEKQFMADCSLLSLVSSGLTPDEALENLKQQIKCSCNDSNIQINPVFERR